MNSRSTAPVVKLRQQPIQPSPDLLEALEASLRRLMWFERSLLRQILGEYELEIPHFMVLMQLVKHDGACLSGELAQALAQPHATTTGQVERLEKKGLIKREFGNERDRRQVRVRITAQGQALARHIKQARRAHLTRALGNLKARDRAHFVRLLQLYLQELERVKQV